LDLRKFDFTWQLESNLEEIVDLHSTFIKSDPQKFNFTWQLPYLPGHMLMVKLVQEEGTGDNAVRVKGATSPWFTGQGSDLLMVKVSLTTG
jgi:hypothetical protein